jgi:hypothetical protein
MLELDVDLLLALEIGPITTDPFTDQDLRTAWEYDRARLMEQSCPRPGDRPWAWWHFEAGRDEHLTEYPLRQGEPIDERANAIDAYYLEPVVYLAEHGHLRDDEIAAIAERANEARMRVGTPAEHYGSGGVDRVDRRAVKLYEAVIEAVRR